MINIGPISTAAFRTAKNPIISKANIHKHDGSVSFGREDKKDDTSALAALLKLRGINLSSMNYDEKILSGGQQS